MCFKTERNFKTDRKIIDSAATISSVRFYLPLFYQNRAVNFAHYKTLLESADKIALVYGNDTTGLTDDPLEIP